MKNKVNKNEFTKKARDKHGEKYDYSLVEYVKSNIKVDIICLEHGAFKQTPNKHLCGRGCPDCGRNKTRESTKYTTKDFIKKARDKHGEKYDYSLVEYTKSSDKVKIICPKHGEFEQAAFSHLRGYKCRGCDSENKAFDLESFVKKSNKVHNNKYDYSLVKYKNQRTKVKIICPKHGDFKQLAGAHTQGCGCPKCSESRGEREIYKYLDSKEILYEREKTFDRCRFIRPLKFDFYLPEYNLCIEFDGKHHFEETAEFGNDKYKKQIRNDGIKNKFCHDNNIPLLRIKYTDMDNISKLIETFIS